MQGCCAIGCGTVLLHWHCVHSTLSKWWAADRRCSEGWHTGSGLFQADGSQSGTQLAPQREQVEGEHIWPRGRGPQLVGPVDKARRFGISHYDVFLQPSIDLQSNPCGWYAQNPPSGMFIHKTHNSTS